MPGHILVSAIPGSHRIYVVVVGVVGLALLAMVLRRRPPRDSAELARFTGWVMLIAILVAPATRVGYLLYPINLFVWAWLLRRSEDPSVVAGAAAPPAGEAADQSWSGDSSTSTENGVIPADVVGETTTPTSQ